MTAALTLKNQYACFGGTVGFYRHPSTTCNSEMALSVYVPPQARLESVPVLYYLSGLTCTEENFMAKAGAQQFAAYYGLILVAPDSSPRNTGIPNENQDWDLGSGAGFYVDATESPWRDYYQMYSYVTQELPALIAAHFPVLPDRQGIFGHSMGGHGALICALKIRISTSRFLLLHRLRPPAAAPGATKHLEPIWGQMHRPGRLTMPANWCKQLRSITRF